jgi:hypothetical protein
VVIVLLSPRLTGLPKDSVANVSQIVTLDKSLLTDRQGKLPQSHLRLLLAGIDIIGLSADGRLTVEASRAGNIITATSDNLLHRHHEQYVTA